jgi:hypothetical protein
MLESSFKENSYQGISGTLSKNISGRGGYFFISGTRSCTVTITREVIMVTTTK